MKKYRKLCLIPLFGTIIYFLIVTANLRKNKLYSAGQTFAYLLVMGFLGAIGVLMGGILVTMVFNNELYIMLLFIFAISFSWPLVTLPVIHYSNKADILLAQLSKNN